MAKIPSLKQWLADTDGGITSVRSDLLKKVDAAIKAHDASPNPVKRDAVKEALDRWRFDQSRQGKDWTQSVRNGKGAVTALNRTLSTVDQRKLRPEELEALKYIARQQSMALQRQFANKVVAFKASTLMGQAQRARTSMQKFEVVGSAAVSSLGTAASVANSGRKFAAVPASTAALGKGGVKGVHTAMKTDAATLRPRIFEFLRTLCPDIDPQSVFDALKLGSVESFVVNLVPFLGAISSGGKMLVRWTIVAKQLWDSETIRDRSFAIRAGDPDAAFDALLLLLDREIQDSTMRAGISTTAFGGKVLAGALDGGAVSGPVLGALETLAEIFQTIAEYVRDYREVKAANGMLKLGALNLQLFEVCPLLGCYFLVVQDHSTIINFSVGQYGTANWMMDVERLVRKIDVVLDKSRLLIKASRFEMPGMESAKGIKGPDWTHTTGIDKVLDAPGVALGKVAGLPAAVNEAIAGRIDDWLQTPNRPHKLDKSRIVGFGSS